jgi:DNA-binding NarL/FixJ family response regulator
MPPDDAAPKLAVMLVDDDVAFQKAFAGAIEATSDMALQGFSGSVAQAVKLLAQSAPDVLVVDLGLPDGSGLEIIAAAHQRWPDCPIMVSTTFADQEHVIRSIEAGASGYLLKDSAPEKIADEIRSLVSGGSPISPRIARHLLLRFRASTPKREPAPEAAPQTLSERESQTLDLIARGFSYDEIAELMQISRNTVMTFVRRIYAKLEVKSKAEAIYEARNHGLI